MTLLFLQCIHTDFKPHGTPVLKNELGLQPTLSVTYAGYWSRCHSRGLLIDFCFHGSHRTAFLATYVLPTIHLSYVASQFALIIKSQLVTDFN